jgi:hypothetical protein
MKMRWFLFLFFALISIAQMVYSEAVYAAEKVQKAVKFYWTCVMHPEVHTSAPGLCPICHMELVKREEKVIEDASKIENRKSISLDQKSFNLSGAKLYTVKRGNFEYLIKSFGKMNGGNQFSLYVSEKDQRFVKTGYAVTVKVPALDLLELHGKLTRIDTYIEPMGRTVKVDGILSYDGNLRAETSLIATIHLKKDQIIKIPEEAVLHTGEKDYVFILDQKNSVLNPLGIKIGLISNGEVEVLDGLKDGDVITTHANFLIDSESRMKFNRE